MSMIELTHEEREQDRTTMLGFWTYLMTDLVLFASLFATYAVLKNGTWAGPASPEIFSAPFVLAETLILLASSFTCGLMLVAASMGKRAGVLAGLIATFLLGALFLGLELWEFGVLLSEGHGWQASAFLSSYFTLVGTHGLHIFAGLIWAAALVVALVRTGLTRGNLRKLALFGMFWHFLDLVWIFIFTVVYLMGL